jgi:hypothetical protein
MDGECGDRVVATFAIRNNPPEAGMTAREPPASPPADDAAKRRRARKVPAAQEPATKVTPVDRTVGEARGNLRDRADAFNRRRGGKEARVKPA